MEITTLLHLLKQLMTTKETFEVCKLNLMGWTWKETISRWVSKFKLHTRSTRAIFHKGSDINYLMLKQNLKLLSIKFLKFKFGVLGFWGDRKSVV